MAIEFSNAISTPAIVYNRIFMNSLKITQLGENRNDVPPKYSLTIEYTIYGIDNKQKRYFLPKVHIINIDDYLNIAMQKAQVGDMDLLVAMQAIEAAIAKILEDQESLDTIIVS